MQVLDKKGEVIGAMEIPDGMSIPEARKVIGDRFPTGRVAKSIVGRLLSAGEEIPIKGVLFTVAVVKPRQRVSLKFSDSRVNPLGNTIPEYMPVAGERVVIHDLIYTVTTVKTKGRLSIKLNKG
jgi:hypothetical protein